MTKTLEIKLASIAVHAEEMMSDPKLFAVTGAAAFDQAALNSLLSDKEVRAYLDDKKNAVYLPLKRSARSSV